MKKSILKLGRVLNKVEQKTINGGGRIVACNSDFGCPCNCWIDSSGSCVTELVFMRPCDD
jgi:hypothetical protein